MAAIHIRHVPEEVVAALKERARRHGRSMQQELVLILKVAATSGPTAASQVPVPLVKVRTGPDTSWRREEIYGDEGR